MVLGPGSLQSTLQFKAPQTCTLNLSQTTKTCTLAGPRTDGPSDSQGKARQAVWRFGACFLAKLHGKERRQQRAASPFQGGKGWSQQVILCVQLRRHKDTPL